MPKTEEPKEKRDLVFLWINEGDDGVFKDQNVNFGSEKIFNVERVGKELVLMAETNAEYITDFYTLGKDSIANITAFVGMNGSGKTRMCRILANLVSGVTTEADWIVVVRVTHGSAKPKFEAFSSIKNGASVRLESQRSDLLLKEGVEHVDLVSRKAIYYSPVVDFSNMGASGSKHWYEDISSNYLLRDDWSKRQASFAHANDIEPADLARSRDLEMHLALLDNAVGREVLSTIPGFHDGIPKYLISTILSKSSDLIESGPVKELMQLAREEEEMLKQRVRGNESPSLLESQFYQEMFPIHFGRSLLRNFLFHVNNGTSSGGFGAFTIGVSKGSAFIDQLIRFFRAQSFISSANIIRAIKTSVSARHQTEFIFPAKGFYSYAVPSAVLKELFKLHQEILGELFSKNKLIENYSERQGFLTFDYLWSLSSGEKAYLDLYARLFSVREKFITSLQQGKKWPDQLYVILDEADLGFHPAWQQNLVKQMVMALPRMFTEVIGGPMPRIHVIIATHSPVTLSDIPHYCVVPFVTQEQVDAKVFMPEWTFGANIHELYRSSFFLSKHFMGEFAHDKIQAVLDDLNKEGDVGSQRAVEMKSIIDLIGEPVIRSQLRRKYDSRFPKGLTVAEQLRFHEEEVKRLNAQLKG